MARLVIARRARRELLELSWPLIDAIEDALSPVRVAAIRHRGVAYEGDPR
ncbi:MAG: hypothetical protein ABW196_01140 [Solirubrobacterales bacterium]